MKAAERAEGGISADLNVGLDLLCFILLCIDTIMMILASPS